MSLNWDQEAAQTLREAGLKATPQRIAILRALAGDETHPTAQELFERLHSEFPSLSVATVYNTLSALTRMAKCVPLDLGGPVRFDPNVATHDHAVCEGCGRIRDVALLEEAAEPKNLAFSAATKTEPHGNKTFGGFEVRRVERIYRGVCTECAGAAQAK